MSTPPRAEQKRHIQAMADRCVKCGLCLPSCPTYRLTRNEAESPRGRVSLVEAMVRGDLPAGTDAQVHLEHCLLCRACERACPSGVTFGALIDQARCLSWADRPASQKRLIRLMMRPRWVRAGMQLGRLLPHHWLPAPPALIRAAQRLARQQPARLPPEAPRSGPRIGLFLGCVGHGVQPGLARAAHHLLTLAGAQVVTPRNQVCCGALPGHAGDLARAARCATLNAQAFNEPGLDAVVSLASGCGLQLAEQAPPLPVRHWDLLHYLVSSGLIAGLRFRPLEAQAALHLPCTLQQQPGAVAALQTALAHIPGLDLTPLDSACCGAGGLHLLTQAEQAAQLRAPKLSQIADLAPDLLISGNIGCALHLAAGLDSDTLVPLHPVALLAQQVITGRADSAGDSA